jgi:hypothetical protein
MATPCFYCNGLRIADPARVQKVKLYRKLDSNYGLGLTGIKKTTRYYEKEIAIDRCNDCYEAQRSGNRPATIIGLTGLVLGAVVGYVLGRRWYVALFAGLGTALAGLIAYLYMVHHKKLKALGVKDVYDFKTFGPAKVLLDEGWDMHKP